jgi:hypothetical protein
MATIKAITAQISANLKITAFDEKSELFKKLNVPASIGLALPDKCTIPAKGQVLFAKMEYSRLLDKNGKPTIGIGLQVNLPNGETKIISLNSLLRSYYVTEPQPDAKNEGKFITRGVERVAAVNVLNGVQTMNYAPVALLEKYLCGKTIEKTDTQTVFTPKYNSEHELIGYEESEKSIFTASDATSETSETSETGEKTEKKKTGKNK